MIPQKIKKKLLSVEVLTNQKRPENHPFVKKDLIKEKILLNYLGYFLVKVSKIV